MQSLLKRSPPPPGSPATPSQATPSHATPRESQAKPRTRTPGASTRVPLGLHPGQPRVRTPRPTADARHEGMTQQEDPVDEELIRWCVLATRAACSRMTAPHLKALQDSVGQARSL